MSPENPLSDVSDVAGESSVLITEQASYEGGSSAGLFLLNQSQAAALLGISTRTLARRSADGSIPSFLIGRRRVYSRFRLTQWVAEQAA
jgi:Bacterial regulatory protein, Fis family